eukprot:3742703-Prymnesium_polylepis.1
MKPTRQSTATRVTGSRTAALDAARLSHTHHTQRTSCKRDRRATRRPTSGVRPSPLGAHSCSQLETGAGGLVAHPPKHLARLRVGQLHLGQQHRLALVRRRVVRLLQPFARRPVCVAVRAHGAHVTTSTSA